MAAFPVLNYQEFLGLFSEFNISIFTQNNNQILNFLWVKVRNITPTSIFGFDDQRALYYFYTVLAHLCQLFLTKQSGRLVNATTGNTSSGFETLTSSTAGSLQWWYETSYGSEIAQLIKQQGGFDYVY